MESDSIQPYSSILGFLVYKRKDGKDGATHVIINSKCSIGRSDNCDIRIRQLEVSREHCLIQFGDDPSIYPSLIALAPTLVNGILVPIQSTQKLVSNDTIGIESHQFSFKYDSATTFRSIDREKKHITVKQSFIGSASTPMKNYIATTEIHQRSAHISQNDSLKQHSISMSGQIIRLDMPEKDSYRTESAVKNRNLDKNISEKTKNNPETNKESSNEAITNGEFLKLKIQNDTAASTNEVKLMKDSPIHTRSMFQSPPRAPNSHLKMTKRTPAPAERKTIVTSSTNESFTGKGARLVDYPQTAIKKGLNPSFKLRHTSPKFKVKPSHFYKSSHGTIIFKDSLKLAENKCETNDFFKSTVNLSSDEEKLPQEESNDTILSIQIATEHLSDKITYDSLEEFTRSESKISKWSPSYAGKDNIITSNLLSSPLAGRDLLHDDSLRAGKKPILHVNTVELENGYVTNIIENDYSFNANSQLIQLKGNSDMISECVPVHKLPAIKKNEVKEAKKFVEEMKSDSKTVVVRIFNDEDSHKEGVVVIPIVKELDELEKKSKTFAAPSTQNNVKPLIHNTELVQLQVFDPSNLKNSVRKKIERKTNVKIGLINQEDSVIGTPNECNRSIEEKNDFVIPFDTETHVVKKIKKSNKTQDLITIQDDNENPIIFTKKKSNKSQISENPKSNEDKLVISFAKKNKIPMKDLGTMQEESKMLDIDEDLVSSRKVARISIVRKTRRNTRTQVIETNQENLEISVPKKSKRIRIDDTKVQVEDCQGRNEVVSTKDLNADKALTKLPQSKKVKESDSFVKFDEIPLMKTTKRLKKEITVLKVVKKKDDGIEKSCIVDGSLVAETCDVSKKAKRIQVEDIKISLEDVVKEPKARRSIRRATHIDI